jgi:hypothetical protein
MAAVKKITKSPKEILPGQTAWGIFDRRDGSWIGNDDGPQLYIDCQHNGLPLSGRELAQLGAAVIGQRMRLPMGQLIARQYNENANQEKETIYPAISAEQALSEIEAGRFI